MLLPTIRNITGILNIGIHNIGIYNASKGIQNITGGLWHIIRRFYIVNGQNSFVRNNIVGSLLA